MINNYINHIAFVIDRSGSMSGLKNEVVSVFDSQIQYLATRSKELDQETRVSVYLFNGSVECLVYDKDVLRLPSLKSYYEPYGSTALIDATLTAISDLKKVPELYGDHSTLVYILTDGVNTDNNHLSSTLNKEIKSLPENWTVAVLVPSQLGVREAKGFGFPAENIQVWSTDTNGLKEVGETMKRATNNFMQARTTGLRSTKSLFNFDNVVLTNKVVKNNLTELSGSEYSLLPVRKDSVIKDFVESWTGKSYIQGSAYYQLTKKEEIQENKQIVIQNKLNGKVYSGNNARNLLGLPNNTVKVTPVDFNDWNIFIQSTSVNRKLVAGTNLILIK